METENNERCASLTDDEIIALCTIAENENEDDTDENTIINDDQPKVISHNEATSHLEQLKKSSILALTANWTYISRKSK